MQRKHGDHKYSLKIALMYSVSIHFRILCDLLVSFGNLNIFDAFCEVKLKLEIKKLTCVHNI